MSQRRQLLGFSMGSSPNHSFIGTLASIIFSVFFYQIHLKFLWGDKKSQSLIPLFILSITNAKMKSKRVYNSEYWNALGGYTVLTVGCWTFQHSPLFLPHFPAPLGADSEQSWRRSLWRPQNIDGDMLLVAYYVSILCLGYIAWRGNSFTQASLLVGPFREFCAWDQIVFCSKNI